MTTKTLVLALLPLLACGPRSSGLEALPPPAAPVTKPVAAATKPVAVAAKLVAGDFLPGGDISMLAVDGSERTLSAMAGEHGTLVIFTTNHCPWAQAWEARLTALGNEFMARGVGVIAVNPNDPAKYSRALFEKMQPAAAKKGVSVGYSPDTYEEMQRRAKAAGMRFPYVVDATSMVARSFGATKTPQVYLFDEGGRLVYQGAVDDNPFAPEQVQQVFLRDALEALTAGESQPRVQSHAVGCSIAFRD